MLTRRTFLLAAATTALAPPAGAPPAHAQQPLRIRVSHTEPGLYGPVHERIRQRFAAANPAIAVEFEASARDYDEQLRNLLRLAMIGEPPDAAFVGLNRVALLADRGIPVALDPWIGRDADWPAIGLSPPALSVGQVAGRQVALPFAISIPIVFFNADLVRRAGGNPEDFPRTWDGINALARRIAALGPPITGGFVAYEATGNWMFIALVESLGGR